MKINYVIKNSDDAFNDNLILGLNLITKDFRNLKPIEKCIHLDELSHKLGSYSSYPDPNPIHPELVLSSLGRVLAEVFSESFGWSIVTLRENHENKYDDVLSLIDHDHCYRISPIGACYASSATKNYICRNLYEKIKNGNLPETKSGSFHEVELRD
jgi:hypothetical protein